MVHPVANTQWGWNLYHGHSIDAVMLSKTIATTTTETNGGCISHSIFTFVFVILHWKKKDI